jgi:hypothetical protein
MRLAASLKLLISLLLLAGGRVFAFATPLQTLIAAVPPPRRRLDRAPCRAARLAEAVIFPARYFFGPYAIGPP